MGRPKKPAALREIEGDRSKGSRPIVPDVPLQGTPELPGGLDAVAAEHFTFLAAEFGGVGVFKRADGVALAKLADLWSKYWRASADYDADPTDDAAFARVRGFAADWDRAAGKLGIQIVDRAKIVVAQPVKADPTEERFFKVTG